MELIDILSTPSASLTTVSVPLSTSAGISFLRTLRRAAASLNLTQRGLISFSFIFIFTKARPCVRVGQCELVMNNTRYGLWTIPCKQAAENRIRVEAVSCHSVLQIQKAEGVGYIRAESPGWLKAGLVHRRMPFYLRCRSGSHPEYKKGEGWTMIQSCLRDQFLFVSPPTPLFIVSRFSRVPRHSSGKR